MDSISVGYKLTLAAFTAEQGGGGQMEAEALIAVTAMRMARNGKLFTRIKAALLVGAWCRKYANNG